MSLLKRVSISDSRAVSTADLEKWLSTCDRIVELRLTGLAGMMRFPAMNARVAKTLSTCILNRNPRLSDVNNIAGLTALQALSLAGARSLEHLPSLSKVSGLKAVNLCGCSNLRLQPGILPESVTFLSVSGIKPSGTLQVGKPNGKVGIDVRQYSDYSDLQSEPTIAFCIQDAPPILMDRLRSKELLIEETFRPSRSLIWEDSHELQVHLPPYTGVAQATETLLHTRLSQTYRVVSADFNQELAVESFSPYRQSQWSQLPMLGEWRSEDGSFKYVSCPYIPDYMWTSPSKFNLYRVSRARRRVAAKSWAGDARKLHTDDSLDNTWKPGPLAALTIPGESGNQVMIPLIIMS